MLQTVSADAMEANAAHAEEDYVYQLLAGHSTVIAHFDSSTLLSMTCISSHSVCIHCCHFGYFDVKHTIIFGVITDLVTRELCFQGPYAVDNLSNFTLA